MRSILNNRKGQLTLGGAPSVVLIVGFVFLVMATIAFISEKYGDALTDGSTAQNVTNDLNTEISKGKFVPASIEGFPVFINCNIQDNSTYYQNPYGTFKVPPYSGGVQGYFFATG